MKWKNIVLAGAFVGTFTLGAMFSPIGQSEAFVGENSRSLPVSQTAGDENSPQTLTDCPVSGQMMGKGAGMGHYFAGSMSTVIAEALDISVEELRVARSEGKSVADLAEEKNVALDDLKTKVIEARKGELQQLVTDGAITQEQMDAMLTGMESRISVALENDGFGYGHMNGRGGMGNGMMNGMMNGRGGMGNGMMNDGNMSF